MVSSRVTIERQPGAVLEVTTTPDPNGISSEAALFVRDTDHVTIRGLDIRMTGDTYRFGFLTPKSYDNQLVIGPGNESLVVKDCGENDSIIGTANIVDNTMDPCN